MVLVVGGAGYIGSHICKLLRELGEPHIVFDNLEKGHLASIPGSKLFRGDLRNQSDIERVFAENQDIETVMHFAAYIEVGESVAKPSEFYENNVIGVKRLIDCMVDRQVKQFIFSSTAALFGEPKYSPIDEAHPVGPTNPYGETKLAVERMLAAYDQAYGLKSVCLRYFNASGADPEGQLGEDHHPESHLIPLILFAALGKRDSIKVFGVDYPTPDGTCVRDYIHVSDLAKAHVLALKHLRQAGESKRFNLGNGIGFSVQEVIKAAKSVTGLPINVVVADRRPGDSPILVGSSEAIRREWGWVPEYPDLTTIIEHAYRWFVSHPDGYGD